MLLKRELFAGLIVFLYKKIFFIKTLSEVESTDKYMNLELIKAENRIRIIDTNQKMIFCYIVELILILFYLFFQLVIINLPIINPNLSG